MRPDVERSVRVASVGALGSRSLDLMACEQPKGLKIDLSLAHTGRLGSPAKETATPRYLPPRRRHFPARRAPTADNARHPSGEMSTHGSDRRTTNVDLL